MKEEWKHLTWEASVSTLTCTLILLKEASHIQTFLLNKVFVVLCGPPAKVTAIYGTGKDESRCSQCQTYAQVDVPKKQTKKEKQFNKATEDWRQMETRSMNGLTEQHEQRLFCFCPTAFYFMRTLTVLGSFWHKKSPFRSKQTQTKAQ